MASFGQYQLYYLQINTVPSAPQQLVQQRRALTSHGAKEANATYSWLGAAYLKGECPRLARKWRSTEVNNAGYMTNAVCGKSNTTPLGWLQSPLRDTVIWRACTCGMQCQSRAPAANQRCAIESGGRCASYHARRPHTNSQQCHQLLRHHMRQRVSTQLYHAAARSEQRSISPFNSL